MTTAIEQDETGSRDQAMRCFSVRRWNDPIVRSPNDQSRDLEPFELFETENFWSLTSQVNSHPRYAHDCPGQIWPRDPFLTTRYNLGLTPLGTVEEVWQFA